MLGFLGPARTINDVACCSCADVCSADDYYGGYETLAMFTNYDTDEVDFESAYNFANFGDGFK
jgi:hypothetical protein